MTAYDGLKIYLGDLEIWLLNLKNWQTKKQISNSKKTSVIISEINQILFDESPNYKLLAKHNFELHRIILRNTSIEVFSISDVWDSYFDMLELIMSADKSEGVPLNRLSKTTIKVIES